MVASKMLKIINNLRPFIESSPANHFDMNDPPAKYLLKYWSKKP
jgi:hypothetical protein